MLGHFLRQYDYWQAQKVTHFVANSEEVKKRIQKFYRREATVICPPVDLPKALKISHRGNYYLIVSRLVGGKGIELGIKAAKKYGFKLKVVGEGPLDFARDYSPNIQFLGAVSDQELVKLYSGAKAFLALSKDEDFGITPVEAMACGTPVVAFRGGGYAETVTSATGVFFEDYSVNGLVGAMERLKKLKLKPADCLNQARKFSKSRFKREIKAFVETHAR